MGLFDDLGKALKKAADDKREPDPGHQAKGGGEPAIRAAHPGYAKIALWMRRKYKGRIPAGGDAFQKNLELEQLTAEATTGLSAKTRKGFLEYLRAQNYEQLLK